MTVSAPVSFRLPARQILRGRPELCSTSVTRPLTCPGGLRCSFVPADEPAEDCGASKAIRGSGEWVRVVVRGVQVHSGALVAAGGVVVIEVSVRDCVQVSFAGDEHLVGAFGAGGACELFVDRVHPWALRGCAAHIGPYGLEHCVERRGELGIPIPDGMGEVMSRLLEVGGELAGRLRGSCQAQGQGFEFLPAEARRSSSDSSFLPRKRAGAIAACGRGPNPCLFDRPRSAQGCGALSGGAGSALFSLTSR